MGFDHELKLHRSSAKTAASASPRRHANSPRLPAVGSRSRSRLERVRAGLSERGIATQIHYPIPIHLQGAYRDLGGSRGDFPAAQVLFRTATGQTMLFPSALSTLRCNPLTNSTASLGARRTFPSAQGSQMEFDQNP